MTTQDTTARLEQIRESFTGDDIDWLIGEVYRLSVELAAYRESYDDAAIDRDEVTSDARVLLDRLVRVEAERNRLAGLLDHATRFDYSDLPADDINRSAYTVSAEPRRGGMWVVVHRGYLSTDGWTTSRNRACQYDRDTAIRLAEQHSHTVKVHGMTAADVLAQQAAKETQ